MERMVLLGVLVNPDHLGLTKQETLALSVLSTSIIKGECLCGGIWETVQDEDDNVFPTIVHEDGCPATATASKDAVKKIIYQIVKDSLGQD
jgi:hypothetical protein